MAENEKFFPEVIDRTPYGSCAFLAVTIIILYCLGAALLWQAGSWVKHHQWYRHFNGQLESLATPNLPDSSKLLDKANQAVQQQVDKQTQKIENDAVTAAQNQVKQQVDQAKDTVGSKLNSYLNQ